MTGPKQEEMCAEAERLAKPASSENDRLNGKKDDHVVDAEEGARSVAREEEQQKEEELPKLSVAEFRAYNSMAERMDYFFCSHLSTHHAIEEQHIFPVLAQKMPEFKQGKNAAELLRQHEEIHRGMDAFEEYLKRCRSGETELQLSLLKEKMDSWGTVLWAHLDQEVKTLGAENMRRYWTVEEMKRMPM
ncbi:hypothetical protein PZA11_002616 [Diplocarpon coronariae]